MASVIGAITMNVLDLERASTFWASTLDYEIAHIEPGYVAVLRSKDRTSVSLFLQLVDDLSAARQAVHIDVTCTNVEKEVERMVALGAESLAEYAEAGDRWVTMRDFSGVVFDVACSDGRLITMAVDESHHSQR